MGIFDFTSRNSKSKAENLMPKSAETDIEGNMSYWIWLNEACKAFYSSDDIEKFSNSNAYKLATNISEIFFPIDAIADRVSALKFDLVDVDGNLKDAPTNIARLMDEPNPFSSFSDLVYNSVFNELSDGNNYIYTKTSNSFKKIDPNTISSIWVLKPDDVTIKTKDARPDFFNVTSKEDLIAYYEYSSFDESRIDAQYIVHERSLPISGYSSKLKSSSPLSAARRNIDNLIAVYHARYKVYANNGNAGILTRDSSGTQGVEQAIDPVKRDSIIEDILNRNGLVGDKKLWTVSSIPLKFIKTLATISELQPFEETQADALQIAGIFGVDKDLIPMKEGTTYDNKNVAERGLYQNVIKGIAKNKAESFTKALGLNKVGLRLKPNYDDVSVLQEDKETSLKGDSILIDNIIKMKSAGLIDKESSNNIVEKIIEKYNNG